jgi:excisionase family DNA binding protein
MLHGIESAAGQLGISVSTLRHATALKKIATVRIGRRRLISDETLAHLEREGLSEFLTK